MRNRRRATRLPSCAQTAELTGITEAELEANADAFLQTFDTP